ncbi:MAG: DUF1801 domain-containing protein [Melioribacteraceae bacterium]|jgi:hypothetical protein|nr:DUF1801 domain-containing protein [Melioribacteraceae bacterium]
MAKAELKTKENKGNVDKFLNSVDNEQKRNDSFVLLELMKKITKEEPKMWGDSIIGFGNYHYKYESGREGDWFLCGFSPRKQNLSIYLMCNFDGLEDLLADLGKHKKSVGCLYIKKLKDINIKVLEKMIKRAIQILKKKYK